jgi:hypothetical protein
MNTLCVTILTIFLALAVADEGKIPKNPRVVKSTKAYSKAKVACLKKSEELKGKKLTDCIVEYQKEAK